MAASATHLGGGGGGARPTDAFRCPGAGLFTNLAHFCHGPDARCAATAYRLYRMFRAYGPARAEVRSPVRSHNVCVWWIVADAILISFEILA